MEIQTLKKSQAKTKMKHKNLQIQLENSEDRHTSRINQAENWISRLKHIKDLGHMNERKKEKRNKQTNNKQINIFKAKKSKSIFC